MSKHLIPPVYQRDVLIYAFRYALGRSTYVVRDMCTVIAAAWSQLPESDRKLIKDEILFAVTNGFAGMDMDAAEWSQLLDLED